ncbi:MAG: PQQ-dependent sugar dehydrogenase [Devosia nanyangense]|uniref:PQQ-dependent sugar dehydrogenase n=1 Tax=Devosia nanyangense TaxID=1228055 RepID=A0A933L2I7_9HYPH|nr:PQQ-dependent sugar dehydrogenase [Devosia nanyangense]
MPNHLLRGLALALLLLALPALADDPVPPGADQAMGQRFHITPDSLPAPGATASASAPPERIERGDHVPLVPAGFAVQLFVEAIPSPRRLLVGYDGVIYVAAQDRGGILAFYDKDGDGAADQAGGVLQGANNPFGMALAPVGPFHGDLMLGDSDGLYRLPIDAGGGPAPLSAPDAFGPPTGHITREVAVDPKSGRIYVGVGSMGNLDDGEPPMKATIQRFDADGKNQMSFATGMRNVTGMDFEPATGALYAVTMERDGMGDELVPDYFTRVEEGDNFGWPYQYLGSNAQPEFKDKGLKLAAAKVPDVLFAAHSAPLDVAFIPDSWPADYRGDAIVALHGSWNAGAPRGYKLVRIPFTDGKPDGGYENFMTGFWVAGTSPTEVWGRPAALAFDRDGSLLVGDDFGNTNWRVTPPKG